MPRKSQSQKRNGTASRCNQQIAAPEILLHEHRIPHSRPHEVSAITAKTDAQRRYINAIRAYPLTFATGPAGTGKTWLCAAIAAQMLTSGEIERIIITRPAVEAGENLGILPGEIEEKYGPYLAPFHDVLNERLGGAFVEYLVKNEQIVAAPLAYMRGTTFKNAFVILDEGQNTTPAQMKMFLTRIGENTRVVVNGDINQKDIHGISGLEDAINRLSFIPKIKHVEFTHYDVVRSGLCQEICQAYESPLV